MSDERYEAAVVGGGPAGIAAAASLAAAGMRTALVDMNAQLGGQFWRHPDERHLDTFAKPESTGHHHWKEFVRLRTAVREAVDRGAIDYRPLTQVWSIERFGAEDSPTFALHTTRSVAETAVVPAEGETPGTSGRAPILARRVVLAAGAYDRQLPFPGWDLPGVMAAGGVQALLKAHQVIAGHRAVVAGTGPFLLPVAAGLARAGAEVVAVCDANSPLRWAEHLGGALHGYGKAEELLDYGSAFLRHRIPYHARTVVARATGGDRVTGAVLQHVDHHGALLPGTERTLEGIDLVATGWGFTPSLELPLALGAATRVDVDGSLAVEVDDEGRSSVEGLWCAGESTGVVGATEARDEGVLAALSIINDVRGTADAEEHPAADARRRARRIRSLQASIRAGRSFAIAMHTASRVPDAWQEWLDPATIVCRCEEVTFGRACETADALETDGARGLKLTARPGMGWCQGRVCGFAAASIAASRRGRAPDRRDLEPIGRRPIAAPVTIGELAAAETAPAAGPESVAGPAPAVRDHPSESEGA